MLHRLLGSRAFMSIVGTLVCALVVVAGFIVHSGPNQRSLAYCALMPDAIGLHEASKVTIRGIDVGAVTAIHGNGATVRVEFTVQDKYALTGEVSATTVSDSIVADRDLTVLSDGSGPTWDTGTCITNTLTPQSLTTALDAVAHLSEELRGSGDTEPGLGESLRALDDVVAGTGDEVNAMVHRLGSVLGSSDVGIARIGRIIESLSSLAASANRGWTDIESMFTRFPETFEVLDNQLFPMVVELGDALAKVLPMLNELSVLAGGSVSKELESTVPFLQWAAANVDGLRGLLDMVPGIASGFANVTDSATGRISIGYAAPRVALPAGQAAALCAALNTMATGRCRNVDGVPTTDLTQLVLGAVTAR